MTAQVKTARKGRTLAALERAALELFEAQQARRILDSIGDEFEVDPWERIRRAENKFDNACAAHAASKKRKGTK